MNESVLILGTTFSIARDTAAAFSARDAALYLVARDLDELGRIAEGCLLCSHAPQLEATACDGTPAANHDVKKLDGRF